MISLEGLGRDLADSCACNVLTGQLGVYNNVNFGILFEGHLLSHDQLAWLVLIGIEQASIISPRSSVQVLPNTKDFKRQ
jgi:hypothetical protein